MKEIKKKIIIGIIVLLIIIIAILITKKRCKSISYYGEYDQNDGIGPTTENVELANYQVKSKNVFWTIEYYLQKYITYLSLDLNNNLNNTEAQKLIKTESDKYVAIYNMLSENYKKNNNITTDNISNYVKIVNKPQKFVALKMNILEVDNIRIHTVYGNVEDSATGEILGNVYFKVLCDIKNMTYSIEPITGINNIEDIKMETEIDSIEQNRDNQYEYITITDQDIVNKYLNYYKKTILNNPQEIYDRLEPEYRVNKFSDFKEFQEYVENNKKEIEQIDFNNKYSKDQTGYYTQYACLDTNNNYYIFRENAIMDFTIILDMYTIDLPEFVEKYNEGNKQEKVALNINKIAQALDDQDYKYIYSKLVDDFKNNYFKTYKEFEEYAQKTFGQNNKIEFLQYTESENLCTYKVSLTGNNKKVVKTIIMKLQEGTDFIFSFNV